MLCRAMCVCVFALISTLALALFETMTSCVYEIRVGYLALGYANTTDVHCDDDAMIEST